MKTTNKLKDLDVTLDELYDGHKQVLINLSDKPFQFHVVMFSRDKKPDCKISSVGANLWFRTNKGINYERYKSLSTFQTALTKSVGKKVATDGTITFSITTEVSSM